MKLKAFDEINTLRTAERKGMEKGMEKEKITIAERSILQGLDNKTIARSTGLDEEHVERLRKNGKNKL